MTLPTAQTLGGPQKGLQGPHTAFYGYVPVLRGDAQEYEVIDARGNGVGIFRPTARGANGVAQTLNNNARMLIKQRGRGRRSAAS